MKYYIISGEASGDLHGSNLIHALHRLDTAADIRCWGGEKMEAAGATLVKHYRDLAFMGFVEVLKNLRTIFRNLAFCREDILTFKPDVLVLIDYPGFNLRIAKWAHEQGMRVVYYISPQVWAWKENRVKQMKQCIDTMLVILPFEKQYYKDRWNWDVHYVGHPLVDVIDAYTPSTSAIPSQIALLPGSRRQEILKKLPIMLAASRHFPDKNFVVAKAPGIDQDFYDELLSGYENVKTVSGKTYDLLSGSEAALVTSGTATLETALFGVPQVVCYKGNPVSYAIAKRLVTIKYISLVNLIMDKPVVTELIQHQLTVENLVTELKKLLNNPQNYQRVKDDYRVLKQKLVTGSNASLNAARLIIQKQTPE